MSDLSDRLVIPGGPRIIKDPDGAYRLVGAETRERVVDLSRPGTPSGAYRIRPEDLLLAAARLRRDGMSFAAIRKELEVMPHVTDRQLEAFLKVGMDLLEQRIAQGIEPAETVHRVTEVVAELDDDEPV